MPEKSVALIDAGSNTIRMNLYSIADEKPSLMISTKATAGLAGYVKHGSLHPEGVKKLVDILQEFQAIIKALKIDAVYVFATQSLRDLKNSSDILEHVRQETGLQIDLLAGSEEARLSWNGAKKSFVSDDGIYCDIGGGSSEVVFFEKGAITNAVSIPEGSLSLYTKHVRSLLPDPQELETIEKKLRKRIKQALENPKHLKKPVLYAAGGSARSILALMVSLNWLKPDEKTMSLHLLKDLIHLLQKDGDASIKMLLKLSPERIHTLFPGLMILYTLADVCRAKTIVVCSQGVREGYLDEKVLNQSHEE